MSFRSLRHGFLLHSLEFVDAAIVTSGIDQVKVSRLYFGLKDDRRANVAESAAGLDRAHIRADQHLFALLRIQVTQKVSDIMAEQSDETFRTFVNLHETTNMMGHEIDQHFAR